MAEIMTAVARLEAGMRFEGEVGSGQRVLPDASVASGGQNASFCPMELLLVGLAGCTGMDVISILRKQRQEVTGYEVRVQGMCAETHPMVFEDITVEHILTGHHLQHEAVSRASPSSRGATVALGLSMLGKVTQLRHMF
jgi:putative redox protein